MASFKRGRYKSNDTNMKVLSKKAEDLLWWVKMLGEDFSVSNIQDANGPALNS